MRVVFSVNLEALNPETPGTPTPVEAEQAGILHEAREERLGKSRSVLKLGGKGVRV